MIGRVSGEGLRPRPARVGEDPRVVAAIVLAGLVVTAGVSGAFRMGGVVALAAMSLLWLRVNGTMEGLVLVILARGHGITGADLAGFAGLAMAVCRGFVLFSQDRRVRQSAVRGRGTRPRTHRNDQPRSS